MSKNKVTELQNSVSSLEDELEMMWQKNDMLQTSYAELFKFFAVKMKTTEKKACAEFIEWVKSKGEEVH